MTFQIPNTEFLFALLFNSAPARAYNELVLRECAYAPALDAKVTAGKRNLLYKRDFRNM